MVFKTQSSTNLFTSIEEKNIGGDDKFINLRDFPIFFKDNILLLLSLELQQSHISRLIFEIYIFVWL